MSWTDERVEILKKLWSEGRTAAEIASELGGVTRNAVIGKAHRLKLSGRASPIQQSAKKPKPANSNAQQTAKKDKPAKVAAVKKIAAAPAARPDRKEVQKAVQQSVIAPVLPEVISEKDKNRKRVALVDLGANQCRWPLGDPREKGFGFCGCRSDAGEIYCAEHAALAYQVVSRGRTLSAEDLEREEKARAEKMAMSGDQY